MVESPEPDSVSDLDCLSFEEAYRRLGDMVETLESGGLPLAEATALYQKGMALVQRCNQLLNDAELKITQLKDSYNRPLETDGLDWDEGSES
jgi:exodeoxyribonuclease VII small subunit